MILDPKKPLVVEAPNVSDKSIARHICEAVYNAYPGHPWSVGVRADTGMATLRHLCTPEGDGFYLRLKDIDVGCTIVKRAAGEILERYNIPRRGMREDDRTW